MHLLVTNFFSSRNAGDAAILHGMVRSLTDRGALGDVHIVVASAHPEDDRRALPWPVVGSFHAVPAWISSTTLRNLCFLAVTLPLSLVWAMARRVTGRTPPCGGSLGDLLAEYAKADAVVSVGGGNLYSRSAVRGNVMLALHLHSIAMAAALGKPVYLYAQSIGPFASRLQERLVRRTLSRTRQIQVREEHSLRLVRTWGLDVPVRQVPDGAFLFDAAERDREGAGRHADGRRVGVTVRRWFRRRRDHEAYVSTMAGFLRWLVEERDVAVVLVSQVAGGPSSGGDDRVVAHEIAASAAIPDRVEVIEEPLDPAGLKRTLGAFDVVVGTRLHSTILALSMLVPAIAIAYQPKSDGVLRELGLGEFVVSIESLSVARLGALYDRAIATRTEIQEHLRGALPKIRERAAEGGRMIARDLEQLGASASTSRAPRDPSPTGSRGHSRRPPGAES